MTKDLQTLVSETRRLGRPHAKEKSNRRRRAGESSMKTSRESGGLPMPRIVETEKLGEPPARDIFSDFASFGLRVAGLVANESNRHSKPRHCSPFTTDQSTEVIYRPRRRRRNSEEPSYAKSEADSASGRLIAVGVTVFALLAVALIGIAAPNGNNASRPVVRKALPTPPNTPLEAQQPLDTDSSLAGIPEPAGSHLED